jgi:hypothetical protein
MKIIAFVKRTLVMAVMFFIAGNNARLWSALTGGMLFNLLGYTKQGEDLIRRMNRLLGRSFSKSGQILASLRAINSHYIINSLKPIIPLARLGENGFLLILMTLREKRFWYLSP